MPPEKTSGALAFYSATDMLRALAVGSVGAVELCQLHLDRIGRHNSSLNAIVTHTPERALWAARQADDAHAHGSSLGPLQGLPITIKDAIDVAGLPTTSGLPQRAQTIAMRDSPVAAATLSAGAVLLGKTNVSTLTGDWQCDNRLFGRTCNPWNTSRTSGGSTGGGAAAVAAGLSALELGSDIGGSIRLPASFCGIYGHRPSETLAPRDGHFPGTLAPNPAWVMGVLGPLARDPLDLELALEVIAGPVLGEEVGWRLTLPPSRHMRLADFRVAIVPSVELLLVDSEVSSAMDQVVGALERAGARVAKALPEGLDVWNHHLLYSELLGMMLFADLAPTRRDGVAETLRRAANRSPRNPFASAIADGVVASAAGLMSRLGLRERYRHAFRSFFRDWDILLAPVAPVPPFPHFSMEQPMEERILTLNEGEGPMIPYSWLGIYPGLASLSGQPATAFPVARTGTGLPVGLQAIGPYLEDRTTIAFASLLGDLIGGYEPPPGFN